MSWKRKEVAKAEQSLSKGIRHQRNFEEDDYENPQHRFQSNRRKYTRNPHRNYGNRYYQQRNNQHTSHQGYQQNRNWRNHQPNSNQYNQCNEQNQSNANYKQHPLVNNNSKSVKYVKNTGRFQIEPVPIHKLTSTLQRIWNKHCSPNTHCLQQLIALCGPPGCGKSTVCGFIDDHLDLKKLQNDDYILDTSIMCSNVMKENNRVLVVEKVYDKLFEQILQNKNKHKILIIDGFMRQKEHVFVLDFLKRNMKRVNFIFIVLSIDEQTSIKRQLERGQKLVKLSQNEEQKEANDENKKQIRLKDSDLNEDAARKRFTKYNWKFMNVQKELKRMGAMFDVIDSTKRLQYVKRLVHKQLQTQKN